MGIYLRSFRESRDLFRPRIRIGSFQQIISSFLCRGRADYPKSAGGRVMTAARRIKDNPPYPGSFPSVNISAFQWLTFRSALFFDEIL